MINLVEFLDNVKVLLAKILCVNKLDLPLGLDTKLVNGVGINDFDLASIDYVEFLVLVEKEYDIVYNFDAKIFTIGDLYNYIVAYKGKEENKVD